MMIFYLLILYYESTNKEVLIVTSTKDKYRNHTEALKNAKYFRNKLYTLKGSL